MNYGEDEEGSDEDVHPSINAPLGRSGASLCGLKRRIPSEGELSMEGAADTDDEDEGEEAVRHFPKSSSEDEEPVKDSAPPAAKSKKPKPRGGSRKSEGTKASLKRAKTEEKR